MRHLSIAAMLFVTLAVAAGASEDPKVAGACMTCQAETSPGLYKQWAESTHAANDVTCLSCHGAERGDVDAFEHSDALIATLVTPKDCGRCHEGRRARHGAAMMGPDYTWRHGFYDIAQHFYFKLFPEARKLGDPEVDAYVDNILSSDPMHRWVREQPDDLKKQIRTGEVQKICARFFVGEG